MHTDGNDVTFWYLTRVNNTSEWMWTIYKKYITVSLSGVAALSLLSMLFCYLIRGYLSVDHFYRPIKVVYVVEVQSLLNCDT